MPAIGIDFGTFKISVTGIKQGRLNVITDASGERGIPPVVSFGRGQRLFGTSAKRMEVSNWKNTIRGEKLLADAFGYPCLSEGLDYYDVLKDKSGCCLSVIKVDHAGESTMFTPIQVVAMLFGMLNRLASADVTNSPGVSAVVGIPCYYTPIQRRNVIDTAKIGGIDALGVINDTTAAALAFGIARSDLIPDDGSGLGFNVMFVDIGESHMTVSVVSYTKQKLVVKSHAYDRSIGGGFLRDLICAPYASRFGIDMNGRSREVTLLRNGCEKAKTILSANDSATIAVDNIARDVDIRVVITRDTMESKIADWESKIEKTISNALDIAKLGISDINLVVPLGGSTRVPLIKDMIGKCIGGASLAWIMDLDESVSRGCAYRCAMLSPMFRAGEFKIVDCNVLSIWVKWFGNLEEKNISNENCGTVKIFEIGSQVPSTKLLSFDMKEDFFIEMYSTDGGFDENSTFIRRYSVSGVNECVAAVPSETVIKVKVKARIDSNGELSLYDPDIHFVLPEKQGVPEAAPEADQSGNTCKTSDGPDLGKSKRVEIGISLSPALSLEVITKYKEAETMLCAYDLNVLELENCKNGLEEYIYTTKDKLSGIYREFVSDQTRQSLENTLGDYENWIYSEEGGNAITSQYKQKRSSLEEFFSDVEQRYKAFNGSVISLHEARCELNSLVGEISASNDTTKDESAKFLADCSAINKCIEDYEKQLRTCKKTESIAVTEELITSSVCQQIGNVRAAFATPKIEKPMEDLPPTDKDSKGDEL